MSKTSSAPYATLHDAPKFEKRSGVVGAPWFKEQAAVKSVRGQDPLPYITCNSKTAPYATFHNVPKAQSEQSAPLPETSVKQQAQPTNGSQLPQERKFSTPYGTANDVVKPRTQRNLAKVHQAPWDRSDHKLDHHPVQPNVTKAQQAPWERNDVTHHKVQPRFPRREDAPNYTSSNAPYATDSKRG